MSNTTHRGGNQVREMRELMDRQNEMISMYQKRESEITDQVKRMYSAAVKYGVKWSQGPGLITDAQYPSLRHEDLLTTSGVQQLDRCMGVFGVICAELENHSTELRSIYREMDLAVESSMATFRTLQANEENRSKGHKLLGSSSTTHQTARPETPEMPLADRSRADSAVATSENSPKSTTDTKKPINKENGVGSKKTASKTLGDVLASTPLSKPVKK